MSSIIKFYKYFPIDNKCVTPSQCVIPSWIERLQLFVNQEIWMTPLRNFNDPFEGIFKIKSLSPEAIENDQELLNSLLQAHQKTEPLLTKTDFMNRIKSPTFINELNERNQKPIEDLFSEHGALCLTLSPLSIPMWAYYGRDHSGCCIEFELDFSKIDYNTKYLDDFLNGEELILWQDQEFCFMLIKVTYGKESPIIDLAELNKLKKITPTPSQYEPTKYLIKNSAGFKFDHWLHEQEYRLIANANSEKSGLLNLQGYVPFLKVTGIIMGCKILSSHREEIINRFGNDCTLYDAKQSKTDYRIYLESIHAKEKLNTPIAVMSE